MIPATSRSSVVFPEPLRPIRPTASPGAMLAETSRSAQTSVPRDAAPRDEQLLQRPHGLRVDAEAAAGAVDLDGARLRHALDGSAAARRTMPASTRMNAGSAFGISIRS